MKPRLLWAAALFAFAVAALLLVCGACMAAAPMVLAGFAALTLVPYV
jgi:hypothetical protein